MEAKKIIERKHDKPSSEGKMSGDGLPVWNPDGESGRGYAMPARKHENGVLAVFSAAHFAVDLSCIFLMTAFVIPLAANRMEWIWCVVIYNLFAFAFQMPVGAFGDRYGRPERLAAAGCWLIALAYLFLWATALMGRGGDLVSVSGTLADSSGILRTAGADTINAAAGAFRPFILTAAVVAGIGNSCFHVGGGIVSLRQCGGRAARPGIFVSTGAFGVYLAPKLASYNPGLLISVAGGAVLMALCGAVLFRLKLPVPDRQVYGNGTRESKSPSARAGSFLRLALPAAFCLFLTIVIRSYTGGLMGYSWKSVPMYGFLFTAGIVFGKMAGGLAGDRIGWMKSAVGSLLLAAVLLPFAEHFPACGMLGVLLFNMTMPITLTAMAALSGPDNMGTAFGVTTFALFLGTLPSIAGRLGGWNAAPVWVIPVTILVSAAAIAAGLMGLREYNRRKRMFAALQGDEPESPGSYGRRNYCQAAPKKRQTES